MASQNSILCASLSNRINPLFHATNACSVQYTIGPSLYPNSPIRSSTEAFAELQRYYHNLANSNITGSINTTNYNVATDAAAQGVAAGANAAAILTYFANLGSGVFGINLDSVSNRSDVMMSGLNTLNSNIILNMTYGTSIGNGANDTGVKFDSYVHLDMVLAIEAGVLTVRV